MTMLWEFILRYLEYKLQFTIGIFFTVKKKNLLKDHHMIKYMSKNADTTFKR